MRVSPHTHTESPLTGSTLVNLIKRAKDLGRTHFAYTDLGHLSSALKAYGLTKKAGLKFIPGIEIYFKDSNCSHVAGTSADRCRYFTGTIYCQDQAAYQELCRLVSDTDFATIDVYEEKQQLWTWEKLEKISRFNTAFVVGGIHCMVGKVMLASKVDVAEAVLKRLHSLFGKRLSVAMVCEPWSKKWTNVIKIEYKDGTVDSLLSTDQISTDRVRRTKAMDLITRPGHSLIKTKSVGVVSYDIDKSIYRTTLHKGFLPLPGGDVMTKINRFLKIMARKHGINVIATDYAYYANKEDKIVQTMRLEGNDKLSPNFHMKTEEEMLSYMITSKVAVNEEEAKSILSATDTWATQFDNLVLKYEWRLAESGGNPLIQAMEIIKANGRMRWDDEKWVTRLREELKVIAKNPKKDLTAYFFPIRDVLNYYKEKGQLTGPGRGSAGGSLFVYLLGITQINPFKYDLPFSRFFSLDRIMMGELPDIDVDLEDRELLVGPDGKSGYLYGRWGNKAAQISTRTTIRLKSAIKDTNRYFMGKVEDGIETFSRGLPAPPQDILDLSFVFGYDDAEGVRVPGLIETFPDLIEYAQARPREWDIVVKAMGLTRAYSLHASAFVLSDVPVKDVVPIKNGHVTQYEAKECAAAGLIKYDFLVVSQLKDIRVALDLINKKNGEKNVVGNFTHKGIPLHIWDLPEDSSVFRSIWSGQVETLFQINTKSMQPFVVDILPQNIMDLATILALVRPGPMDFIDENTGRNMVEEYVLLRRGESKPDIKELADLLPETYGVICYQEQLNKIARDLAGFPGTEAETLRKNMAKKKMVELANMKPAFIEGACKKVRLEVAEGIWDRMVTFGRYGFSVIHAVEYAHITYACMFLKHYYPLEWWAAILTNATEKEISGKLWPFVKDMVAAPDINLSTDAMVVDYENEKIRAKLGVIRGMGDATIQPLVENRPYKNIRDFIDKNVAGTSLTRKLIHVGVLDSLFPPKLAFIDKLKIYEDTSEIIKYEEKVAKAETLGKKLRAQPKSGEIPLNYIDLHPFKDAAMRKSVLPSLRVDLHALGKEYSKTLLQFEEVPKVQSPNGYDTLLVNGDTLQNIDETDACMVKKDIYVAVTCYVVETKVFDFANKTKKALKMILDADGYVSEKVLWPDYGSGELLYPPELKKGAIATVFFRKRIGKKDMSITGVIVETS